MKWQNKLVFSVSSKDQTKFLVSMTLYILLYKIKPTMCNFRVFDCNFFCTYEFRNMKHWIKMFCSVFNLGNGRIYIKSFKVSCLILCQIINVYLYMHRKGFIKKIWKVILFIIMTSNIFPFAILKKLSESKESKFSMKCMSGILMVS
jgi:hypothetical protein